MRRHVLLSVSVAVVCLLAFLARAEAAVVGTYIGAYDEWIEDVTNPARHAIQCWLATPVPGSEPWDVFGANFSSGPLLCTQEIVNGAGGEILCNSIDPVTNLENGLLHATVTAASQKDGTTGCLEYEPGQPTVCAKTSIINKITAVSGSAHDQVIAELPPGSRIVYTTDAVWEGAAFGSPGATDFCGGPRPACAATIPGCPTPVGIHLFGNDGRVAYNAFVDQPTDVGTDVVVSSAADFFNPVSFQPVPITVVVKFTEVTEAGRTMVLTESNTKEDLGGFQPNVGSFYASFLDITTTAKYTGPIEVCINYPDADNDGLVDGTEMSELLFQFLHGENGEFVDRTSSRDTDNNVVCGTVDHLSPFAGTLPKPCAPRPEDNCVDNGLIGDVSSLDIVRDPVDSTKNSLKLTAAGPMTSAELGNPSTSTDYRLCIYDNDGLTFDMPVPAGKLASSWKTMGTKGFKFKYQTGTENGLTFFSVKAGSRSKIKLKAEGVKLPMPTKMPMSLSVDLGAFAYVQLINDKGACFSRNIWAFFQPKVNTENRLKY